MASTTAGNPLSCRANLFCKVIDHSSPRSSQPGAHSTNPDDDGDWVPETPSASERNAAGPGGGTHPRAESDAAGHQSNALTIHRRQTPVLRPEVIIEIPPPVNKTRRYVWLGAAITPLIITLIALSALAIRSQNTSTITAQEATVEARVAMRLAEERAKDHPQYAATAALEATVEARVAMRLAEERTVRAQQSPAIASSAGEPTVGLTADTAAAPPAAPLYARSAVVLNLRRGPGENYESLGLIPPGEQLRLLGRTVDSGWFYVAKTASVSIEEEQGWVAGWLVDVPGDPMLLDVVSPNPLATQRE